VIVIVDSREQRPFVFSDGVETRRAALPVGDYSLAGFEHDVVVERKSLGDFLQSITSERERFERELRQLRGFRLAILMIETDWPTLLMGLYGPRRVSPSAALGSLMAFTMRYNITPILCGDHATGAALTEKIFHLFARMIERDYQTLADVEAKELISGTAGAPA
jgi:ERCC4-type nuclease